MQRRYPQKHAIAGFVAKTIVYAGLREAGLSPYKFGISYFRGRIGPNAGDLLLDRNETVFTLCTKWTPPRSVSRRRYEHHLPNTYRERPANISNHHPRMRLTAESRAVQQFDPDRCLRSLYADALCTAQGSALGRGTRTNGASDSSCLGSHRTSSFLISTDSGFPARLAHSFGSWTRSYNSSAPSL